MSTRRSNRQSQEAGLRPQRRASQKFAQILAQERNEPSSSDFSDSYSSDNNDQEIINRKREFEVQRLHGKSPSKPKTPARIPARQQQQQQEAQKYERVQKEINNSDSKNKQRILKQKREEQQQKKAAQKRRSDGVINKRKIQETQEQSSEEDKSPYGIDQDSSGPEDENGDDEEGGLERKRLDRSRRQTRNKKYDYTQYTNQSRKTSDEAQRPEKKLRSNPPRSSNISNHNQDQFQAQVNTITLSPETNHAPKPELQSINNIASKAGSNKVTNRSSAKYKNKDVLWADDSDTLIYERDRQRWKPQMANIQKVPDAPVFYPTEEEFSDPIRFIESISEKAKQYGICQIVPPSTWDPPKVLQSEFNGSNKKPFKFHPKKQLTSFLCLREADDVNKVNTLKKFNEQGEDQETDEFGFQILNQEWTLELFEKYANWSKKLHFSQPDPIEGQGKPSVSQIESEFWRAIETPDKTRVEALYGQDIESKYFGSGFPLPPQEVLKRARNPEQGGNKKGDLLPVIKEYIASQDKELAGNKYEQYLRYSQHPWNLNKFPFNTGSILQHIVSDDKISGVQVPWVYVGSLMATFCWHIEDHSLLSINYIHYGDEKVWYGVPEYACYMFEEAMKDCLPHLFKADPHLLHRLITMVSPNELIERKVPVYRVVHTPRSFVVTFPNAYHSGFNCGYNFAEAVNFAPSFWLPIGTQIVQKYRNEKRPLTFSFDQLLLQLIFRNDLVQKDLTQIAEFLQELQNRAESNKTQENGDQENHINQNEVAKQLQLRPQLQALVEQFESMPNEHWSMIFEDFLNYQNDSSEYTSSLKQIRDTSNGDAQIKQENGDKILENGTDEAGKISKNQVNTITNEVTLMASAQLQNQVEEFKDALLKLHTEEFFMVGNQQQKDPETEVYANTYDVDCEVCQTDLYQSAVVNQYISNVACSVDNFEYLINLRKNQLQSEIQQQHSDINNTQLHEAAKEGLTLLIRYTPQQLDFILEIVKNNFPNEFEQCCLQAQKMIEQDSSYFQQAKKIRRLENIQNRILIRNQTLNNVATQKVPDTSKPSQKQKDTKIKPFEPPRRKIQYLEDQDQGSKFFVKRDAKSSKILRDIEKVKEQRAVQFKKLEKRLQKNSLYGYQEPENKYNPIKYVGLVQHEDIKELYKLQKLEQEDYNSYKFQGQRNTEHVQFISNRDYGKRGKYNSTVELQEAMSHFADAFGMFQTGNFAPQRQIQKQLQESQDLQQADQYQALEAAKEQNVQDQDQSLQSRQEQQAQQDQQLLQKQQIQDQQARQAEQYQDQLNYVQDQDKDITTDNQQDQQQEGEQAPGEEGQQSMLVTLFMHPYLMDQVNNDKAQIFMQSQDDNQAIINIAQEDGNKIEIKLPEFVGNYQISMQLMTDEYMNSYKEQHQEEEIPLVQVECSIQEEENNEQKQEHNQEQ